MDVKPLKEAFRAQKKEKKKKKREIVYIYFHGYTICGFFSIF